MNAGHKESYLEFGKSGGSTGQPFETRRGLGQEHDYPLVLWWVRKLKAEYSAAGTIQTSYRRSRWAHSAEKRVSPIQPFFNLHKQGRLLSNLFVLASGLIASLNMVALAEDLSLVAADEKRAAAEIPSAQRFSMMKDFVGQHNQYLDLSKLNEFKWSDEIKVADRPALRKRQIMNVVTSTEEKFEAQPSAVRSKKGAGNNFPIRIDSNCRSGSEQKHLKDASF